MRIGKTATILGLIVGLVVLGLVVAILLKPSSYADGTRDGDLIVHGSGWTLRPDGGRLFLMVCDERTSGMRFAPAAPVAIILDIPPNVVWLPKEAPKREVDWVYQSSLVSKMQSTSQPSAEVKVPYHLDGRKRVFSIAGQTFDLANGNVFHLTGEDASEPIIHQRMFDPGLDAVASPDQFDEAYRQHFSE